MKTSTTRFFDRVDDYIKIRPHYPKEIIKVLKNKIGFNNDFIIADIGAGTGISSELFINNENKVFAVEPNTEMREAGKLIFERNSNFISVDGKAESTTLLNNSIDLIFWDRHFIGLIKKKRKLNSTGY